MTNRDRRNRRRTLIKRAKIRIGREEQSAPVTHPEPVNDWTQQTRLKLLGKHNPSETHIMGLLTDMDVEYTREYPLSVNGHKLFVDFMVSSVGRNASRKKTRIAIEIDGGYHFTASQRKLDDTKDSLLMASKEIWSVLRISSAKARGMTKGSLFREIQMMRNGVIRRLY